MGPNSDENPILGEREFDVTFLSGSFSSFLALVSGYVWFLDF